jgi:hypothetical protein
MPSHIYFRDVHTPVRVCSPGREAAIAMHASPSFCIAVTDKEVGDGAAVGAAVGRSVRVLRITYKSPSERRCHQTRPYQTRPGHSTAQQRKRIEKER